MSPSDWEALPLRWQRSELKSGLPGHIFLVTESLPSCFLITEAFSFPVSFPGLGTFLAVEASWASVWLCMSPHVQQRAAETGEEALSLNICLAPERQPHVQPMRVPPS